MFRERVRTLRPSETAWIAALPCAIVMLTAIAWLGPLLAHGVLDAHGEALWPREAVYAFGQPEPVKHARYLLALLGPLLLAAAIVAGSVRRVRLPPARLRGMVLASQAGMVALLVAAVLGQRNVLLPGRLVLWPIFSLWRLAVAALLVLAFLAAVRRPLVARLIARCSQETRALRIACFAVAGALAAIWLLAGVDTDRSAGEMSGLFWALDDPFAILDGRTPLVDFHALYGQLMPYLSAAALYVFGATALTFTLLMAGLGVLTLLLVYAILRRVVRSSPLALALYLPLLAAGFLLVRFPGGHMVSPVKLYSMWPMRYGGAYLVAWLTARQLDRATPRRVWALAFVAGLVLVDNLEFGASALAASVVALLCGGSQWTRRALARLGAELAIGLLAAVLVVVLATLARSGALPSAHVLLEFPRIFGVDGYTAVPMPTLGVHLALYVTFVAAIATAAVRRVRGREDLLLTSMLAWSGVFGLLAGGYFVGRSDELKLVSLFSAWLFALALLAAVILRHLAARRWRRPGIPELAVLFGLALALCSWTELPRPWSQIARLRAGGPPLTYQTAADGFVAEHTTPGAKVAILTQYGHRIAYAHGLTNVAPYSFIEAMVVKSQMTTLIDTIRREHVHRLFLPADLMVPAQLAMLSAAGFSPRVGTQWFSMWSDAPR
ncbi:MAG TPA: hypothetical protein VFF79_12355 [Conexibacter sp.]|jgi:hypothetical protein|nr:hypothetical protein [Conexibacter sp.]